MHASWGRRVWKVIRNLLFEVLSRGTLEHCDSFTHNVSIDIGDALKYLGCDFVLCTPNDKLVQHQSAILKPFEVVQSVTREGV